MGGTHLSAREPVNPHVVALHYRVARNDDVLYKSTSRCVQRRKDFDVAMDDGKVVFELHDHYLDEASARAGVRDYLEEWEFQADLTIGSGKFRLEFVRAEIVDLGSSFGQPACAVLGNVGIDTGFTFSSSRHIPEPSFGGYS